MPQSKIAGIGYYVPKNVFTNNDLTKYMETSDEWIQERTGIQERHYAHRTEETTTTMAVEAATIAIERAGITPQDIDFIVFATLSPDYYFPGCGVLVQRAMKMKEIGALDIRNQCSGFVYALSVADQFIKSGMYKNILVIGSEKHSFGIDFSTRGRNISVIFGDGAGAVVLQPTTKEGQGILSTHLHSDGESAEILAMYNPGTHANHWMPNKYADFDEAEMGQMFMSHAMIDNAQNFPFMDGQSVFKKAVVKFFIYTLAGSLFMLLAFVYLYQKAGSFLISDLAKLKLSETEQFWIFLALAKVRICSSKYSIVKYIGISIRTIRIEDINLK